ncbi:unnamed protein product [Moneuplotes crassus]|uniref:PHD-type domain-containing protein n=1 Tax=Euplotes crassus TaxID=5936 RepID=A0AAD1UBP5_EUPCR|nr:unnamed protein product [Moneuplotes crassus]
MSEPSNQPSSIIKPQKRAPMTSGSLPPTYPEISPSTLQTLSNYTSSQTPISKAPAHLYHSAYASLQSTPAPKSLPPFLRCDICQQLESLDHLLILCQSCLVPVHKSCYLLDLACNPDQLHKKHKGFLITIQGFEVMVKGWTCQRCQHGFKGKCCFCKKEKGCLVKSTLEGEEIWAHVQCVYWYQSVCYQDNVMKKIIVRSHEEEQKSKPMGVCQYCEQQIMGLSREPRKCDLRDILKQNRYDLCFACSIRKKVSKKVSNQDLKGLREVNSNVSFEVKDEDPTDPSEEIDLLKNLALKNNKKGNTKPKIISDSSKKRMQKALEKELEVAQQDTSHISEPSNIDDKKDYEESKIVTSEHQSRSELPPDHIDRKEDLDVDIFDYKQANLKDLMELQRVFARDLDRRMMKQERSFELLSERIEKLDGLNDFMKEVLGKIENLEKVNQNLNTSFKDYISRSPIRLHQIPPMSLLSQSAAPISRLLLPLKAACTCLALTWLSCFEFL